MEKTARKEAGRQAESESPSLHSALRDLVIGAGLQVLRKMLDEERTDLCGPRYKHDGARRATRHGYTDGELVLGGRRVRLKRPRVRSVDGRELELPTWKHCAEEEVLVARAVEQLVIGVATRAYRRSLEPLPTTVRERGTSKSAVSRRFVAGTQAHLDKWMKRPLGAQRITALMIDGIHCGEHVVLVAMGIDQSGEKHILGLQEGATENAAAGRALLADLVERGLDGERGLLVIIDGSKALARAVRDVFGARAFVQRCQVHKKRNVLEQLPERMRTTIRARISYAYATRNVEQATKVLTELAASLADDHPGAAASLREGLAETLTVYRFGLPEMLERTLATTNAVENLNGIARSVSRNVRRWRSGSMVLRWIAIAMREAEPRFNRVRGYTALPRLAKLLAAPSTIDQRRAAA